MFSDRDTADRYFRSLVGILPDDPERPLIIVEGPSDKDALRGVMRGYRVSVIDTNHYPDPNMMITNNRQAVIEFANWLKHNENRTYYVGIIDADYERIESLLENHTGTSITPQMEQERENIHVFTTDYHDMDVHVVCETIMDFMKEQMRGNHYISFVKGLVNFHSDYHEVLWRLIVNAAIEVGLVRLALHKTRISQKHIGKNLSSTRYIDTGLTFDRDAAIQDASDSKEECDRVNANYQKFAGLLGTTIEQTEDVWKMLINGHDLIRIIGICIIGSQGVHASKFAEYGVPKIMRKMYQLHHFEKAPMCNKIRLWAEEKMQLFQ